MVQPRHCSEVGRVDIGGIGGSNQAVGVCRVAHNARLDVLVGEFVHGFADSGEDRAVVLRWGEGGVEGRGGRWWCVVRGDDVGDDDVDDVGDDDADDVGDNDADDVGDNDADADTAYATTTHIFNPPTRPCHTCSP